MEALIIDASILQTLIYLAVVLLIGTLCSFLAHELKISNILFLLIAGIILGGLGYVDFSANLIITLSLLLLILIVFNSATEFKFKEIVRFSGDVIKLVGTYFIINMIVLSTAVYYMFGLESALVAALFSSLMFGIDPAVAMSVLKDKKKKVVEILELESIFNTPLTVIIPFTILTIILTAEADIFSSISAQALPFVQQIMVAIGVGVTISLFVVAVMKEKYLESLSHIALITAAIICYILSELFGGNGVIAVTTFGVIFGNFSIKEKLKLREFSLIFTDSLEIFVFILIGLTIQLSPEPIFYLKALALFIIYLIARFASVMLSSIGEHLTFKEKLFMTLNVPKGVDVAVVLAIVVVAAGHIAGIQKILDLSVVFMLYSILLSVVAAKYSKKFIS